MTNLSYTPPDLGTDNSVADPLTRTALVDVKAAYNTDHDDEGHSGGWIQNGTLPASTFDADTQSQLGVNNGSTVSRGRSGIATEETTTSTSYVHLATPDRVDDVVLPTDGLIFVMYRALLKLTGASNNAVAAIFLTGTQTKIGIANTVPTTAETAIASTVDNYSNFFTAAVPGGNASTPFAVPSSTSADSSLVTTGQVIGGLDGSGNVTHGSPVVIEAAAGTYDVSVKFHVNATAGGTLAVKERKLWVWTMGF